MTEFVIHIEDENKITNSKVIWEYFKGLIKGKYLVTIKSIRKRSLSQNSYYWVCVVPMVKDGLINAGYDEVKENEDAHEIMKHLFLKRQVVSKKDGNVIEISGSTSKLTSLEFSEYLEDIYRWASEYLGIYIPPPSKPIPLYNEPVIARYDNENNLTICE